MTFGEAWREWMDSPRYQKLSPATKYAYDRVAKTLWGLWDKKLQDVSRRDMVKLKEKLESETPAIARMMCAVASNVFKYQYDMGMVPFNPAQGLTVEAKAVPIKRWEEREIDLFMANANGAMRALLMLGLYTGQRNCDLVRIKWTDIKDGSIYVKQRKTAKEVWIPIHPKLRPFLNEWRAATKCPYIICTERGLPMTTDSSRKAMVKLTKALGLEGCTIHGLRKTTAATLAEMGCTGNQIMAITGHTTLKEVSRYTSEAEQKRMAKEAMRKWASGSPSGIGSTP